MKITPVNYIQYNNHNTQNFSGLWGKTSRTSDFEQALGIPKIHECCYYYPFSDEKNEQIDKVVQDNKNAFIDQENGNSKYKIKECKVCTTLPFTEKQYTEYLDMDNKSLINSLTKKIHSFVSDKYTTNEFGLSQKPAENDIISKRLNRNA